MFWEGALIIMGLGTALSGCGTDHREDQLHSRELELNSRQQQFSIHSLEYQSLILLRDSLRKQGKWEDCPHWPHAYEGFWMANIICRHSDGGNWVIGDRLFQTWNFLSTPTGVFVAVSDKKRSIRVLTADLQDSEIDLMYAFSAPFAGQTKLSIKLRPESASYIPGRMTILFPGGGKAVFSVKLYR
jgi:hypothetical protein